MWRCQRSLKNFKSRCGHVLWPRKCFYTNATYKQKEKLNIIQTASELKPGQKVLGYTVEKVVPVPELYLVSVKLSHDKTGAEHLHVARDDPNNVFCVGFRTTPMDNTGVSHILEHTALCGSKKFPCRDPFFSMLTRSLSTFMNAMTGSDFTMYPFSTQNRKDFKNLLSVYLDAVFFPRLTELDFWQEGWRLEHEDINDPQTPLIFKGVVFNEMKGAMSNAETLYARNLQSSLLPHHTYGFNSGGEPINIPELSWQHLKNFHATHYHPSNARFYTYGDTPLVDQLEAIEEMGLSRFSGKLDVQTVIPPEPRWSSPKSVSITCALDPLAPDLDKQTTTSVSYLLDSATNAFENLTNGIISSLLIDGPTSPFYQALIEPNIGSDYSPATGFDSSTRDSSFSVGLQGIHKDRVQEVWDIARKTFAHVVETGFEDEKIAAILHRIQLSQKHQSSNFGLNLIASLMSPWNHGGDPTEFIQINRNVDQFKDSIKNERYLQDKVAESFLENQHRLYMTMSPDEKYEENLALLEAKKLNEMVTKLSNEEKAIIQDKCLQLASLQNAKPDTSCLPSLSISDIDPKIKPVIVDDVMLGGVPVYYCVQPTNGLTYFNGISSITLVADEVKPYLPLFCHAITKIGAGSMDHRHMAQLIKRRTGGLSVSPHVVAHHTEPHTYNQGVLFSSHCLDENLPRMFNIWLEIFTSPTLNNPDRLRTLINGLASDFALSIVDSGHMYAMRLASSSLVPSSQLNEVLGGLHQVEFMKNIAEMDDLDNVTNKLIKIAAHVLENTAFRCSLTMTEESSDEATDSLEGFLEDLPGTRADLPAEVEDPDFKPHRLKSFFEIPAPVNFVSKAIRAVPFNHEDYPKLQILSRLMSSKFLHREIREKGGAYGSGAKVGENVFAFFSYRDPNSLETLNVFDQAQDWASSGEFTDRDIVEAKLSVFSQVDAPVPPPYKGMTLFKHGITDDMRQVHRDRLFAVNREALVDVARRYLNDSEERVSSVAILGPANEKLAGDNSWTILKEGAKS
ncbi:presequence protease, mitochondrial-like [Xenia sp. Carnegie-2017]|uniref:presequence protease, mitochondrial-like n=1 Tax=Xenia sp. Carnegie-2017 TaxID=2897299 RepID=UPI001F03E18A|nr:presequence protease, mitochondrial-like [Xenia sp. Carnegie-2017]